MKLLTLSSISCFSFVCCVVSASDFLDWFPIDHDNFLEIIDNAKPVAVDGKIPSYIQGNLVRLGPSVAHTPKRNFTSYIDALGRVTDWTLDGTSNKAEFKSSIIKSNLWNASLDKNGELSDFARHITLEKTNPGTWTGLLSIQNMDNTDVMVYQFDGDTSYTTVTDFYLMNSIDQKSLRTLGNTPVTGDVPKDATFSGSHAGEWQDPKTGERLLVNWRGKKTAGGTTLYVYTMGSDRVQKTVGSIDLKFLPYSIHSIVSVGNYAVVTVGAISLNFLETGVDLCLSCSTSDNMGKDPAQIYVFSLVDEKEPVKTVAVDDSFFMFHHVNAMLKSETVIRVDYCAYSKSDGFLKPHVLGDMNNLIDKKTRDTMPMGCDMFKSVEFDFAKGEVLDNTNLPLKDQEGNSYNFELPAIHPKFRGKDYCIIYAQSYHVLGSSRLENTGLLKINRCKSDSNGANVEVWHEPNVYVGEPIFVPDPQGTAEDDGSLLVMSFQDGASKLLILNAKTMEVDARIEAPFPLMFEFHGDFFANGA